jgi:excisionase family DNA binding protein
MPGLQIDASSEFVSELADQVADRVADRLPRDPAGDRWLDVAQAAEYLACETHRIHDLVSQGRLQYDGRDGRRGLFRRSTLDGYLEAGVGS